MNSKTTALFVLLVSAAFAHAHIIGTNVPAHPLTAERVAALPAWKSYLENSIRQRQADQDFLHAEMKAHGLTTAIEPPKSASPEGTPLDRTAGWYATAEARHIAENVVSFQTPLDAIVLSAFSVRFVPPTASTEGDEAGQET